MKLLGWYLEWLKVCGWPPLYTTIPNEEKEDVVEGLDVTEGAAEDVGAMLEVSDSEIQGVPQWLIHKYFLIYQARKHSMRWVCGKTSLNIGHLINIGRIHNICSFDFPETPSQNGPKMKLKKIHNIQFFTTWS